MTTTATTIEDTNHPIRLMTRGVLYRAVVSLPDHMRLTKEIPLNVRIVFFIAPHCFRPSKVLKELLQIAWDVETTRWEERGNIYNIETAMDLIAQGTSEDKDSRLFETGWGTGGTAYADPAQVDLFVPPVLKTRLQAALNSLDEKGGAA